VSSEKQEAREIARAATRRALGVSAVIEEPRKLAGGAMHESWAVGVEVDGASRELVVRVSPAGRSDYEKTRREFEVLRVAYTRGVRCPEPIEVGRFESGEDFLIMSRASGDSNPRQLVTSARFAASRGRLVGQLAEDLVRIHQIKPEDAAAAPNMRGPTADQDALAYHRTETESMYRVLLLNPHPAIEWAFRWMDRQIAQLDKTRRAPCVVHGDYRIGNMMYDEDGLTAVLDWEGTHISEPEEDLAWFCTRVWRFGKNNLEAGGIASREAWLSAYENAGGQPVDRERLATWEVLQNIRWAEITMMQARAHLDGHAKSHELAAIGRRTAETELEILRLTGVRERVGDAG
jgi:aminoglycoside phosphotransferase (APT) family kinase protein